MHVSLFVHIHALQRCDACGVWKQQWDLETVSMNANKVGKGETGALQTGAGEPAILLVLEFPLLSGTATVSDETMLSACCSAQIFLFLSDPWWS